METKTYKLQKLLFQFIPRGALSPDPLVLAQALEAEGFVVIENERYRETEKLTKKGHRDLLFKTIQKVRSLK